MKWGATYALGLLGLACTSDHPGDDDQPEADCVDASMVIGFDEAESSFSAIHDAVSLLPGEYEATASWTGEGEATTIAMTLAYEGDSYEITVANLGLYCSVSLDAPLALSVETGDGQLAVNSLSVWVQAPWQNRSDGVHLAAALSADPHDTDWLTPSVFQTWPDIASPDDDATKLWLELESGDDGIRGRLEYEKREVIDAITVIYYRDTLLEWNAPQMR